MLLEPAPPTRSWIDAAASISLPTGLYIDGNWVAGDAGAVLDVVSPRDGRLLTALPAAGTRSTERAVAAARRAFDHGPWPT